MPSRKSEVIKEILRKHPNEKSSVLATWIFNKFPGLWPNQESVRSAIRYLRGTHGKLNKNKRKKLEQFNSKIPKGKKKRDPDIHLPPGKWLVVSDIHAPYHNERALEAAIKLGVDERCDGLLVNGDGFDAYQISQWVRDPRVDSVDKELMVFKEILNIFEKHFSTRAYKLGNHEARLETYLFSNAPRMPSMSTWKLTNAVADELDLDDWIMIDHKQLFRMGKLHGYHGHELPKGLTNPVSIGRGIWLRTSQSAFAGHWHRVDNYTHTSADKKRMWSCYGIGCLCDLTPVYAPVNNWSHGCAIIKVANNKNFFVDNKRIYDGQVY